jgi:hypothetical protein
LELIEGQDLEFVVCSLGAKANRKRKLFAFGTLVMDDADGRDFALNSRARNG